MTPTPDTARTLPPLTAAEVEHLSQCRGDFQYGYDEDQVNRVLGGFRSAWFVCAWGLYDDYGYGGDSDLAGRAQQPDERGHLRPVGPWLRMNPQVWEFLCDPESDLDPEKFGSLLSAEPFEVQDLDDWYTDGFHNVAPAPAGEDCEESIADGEGGGA